MERRNVVAGAFGGLLALVGIKANAGIPKVKYLEPIDSGNYKNHEFIITDNELGGSYKIRVEENLDSGSCFMWTERGAGESRSLVQTAGFKRDKNDSISDSVLKLASLPAYLGKMGSDKGFNIATVPTV